MPVIEDAYARSSGATPTITAINGIIALVCMVYCLHRKTQPELLKKAYQKADSNKNQILEPEELRQMAIGLNVIRSSDSLPQNKIEERIKNCPIPAIQSYLQ